MTRAELEKLLRRRGAPRADEIAALALPCLRLDTEPAIGELRTQIGGLPSLAPDQIWPCSTEGAPMTFIGQLDLSDLDPTPIAGELPRRGLIGWFFDTEASLTQGPPEFAMTFAVDPSEVHRVAPPPGARVLAASAVSLRPAWSLPSGGIECPFIASLALTSDERKVYRELREEWELDGEPSGHRLLGYAAAFDDPYVGTALDFDPELHARWFAGPPQQRMTLTDELATAARQLRSIVTFSANDEMDWADGAPLSYLLKREAWARGAFHHQSPSREAAAWCQGT